MKILLWPHWGSNHRGSNHRPCGSKSSSLTATLWPINCIRAQHMRLSASPTGTAVTRRGLTYRVIELPYEGDAVSMLIAMPRKGTPLSDIIRHVSVAAVHGWAGLLTPQSVHLSLPRWGRSPVIPQRLRSRHSVAPANTKCSHAVAAVFCGNVVTLPKTFQWRCENIFLRLSAGVSDILNQDHGNNNQNNHDHNCITLLCIPPAETYESLVIISSYALKYSLI